MCQPLVVGHDMVENPNSSFGTKLLRRWSRAGSDLTRDRSGSVAIEFAMLVLPFSVFIFMILETCLVFAAQEMLSNATDNVSRQLRTGQLRPDVITRDSVRNLLCQNLEVIVTSGCPGLKFDLRNGTFHELAEAAKQRPVVNDNGDATAGLNEFVFQPGQSSTRNMLRVYYDWPILADFLRGQISSFQDGKVLLGAANTWQNEPF